MYYISRTVFVLVHFLAGTSSIVSCYQSTYVTRRNAYSRLYSSERYQPLLCQMLYDCLDLVDQRKSD